MHKQVFLEQYQRRLIELSFPTNKLRRKVEDINDHHGVLLRAALKEGLDDDTADSKATSELGDPVALAIEDAEAYRQSSWWGRHPIIGYIALPIISLFPAFVASVFLMFGVALLYMNKDQWNTLFQNARSVNDVKPLLEKIFELHLVVLMVFALPFCWMARRSASGLGWLTVVCIVFASQGMFLHLYLPPRGGFPLRYEWTPNWLGVIGPFLLIAGAYYLRWKKLKPLPPILAHLAAKHGRPKTILDFLNTPLGEKDGKPAAHKPPKEPWLKKAVRTPTYWVIIILFAVGVPLFVISKKITNKNQTRNRGNNIDLRGTTWPAERDQVTADIAARQGVRETTHETTINLAHYVNMQLSDSADGNTKSVKENSLSELQNGNHIYGAIPFNVQGRIQLMGRGLERWKRIYPAIVKDIKIGHKCNHIYIFHGENCAGMDLRDTTVAKLVLHYTDDTQSEIEIKSGVNLLDWWGPIYKTGANKDRREISSPDSEIAWVGYNEFIKKYQPDWSLRLYKSTFDNPNPAKEIASMDYVSTMTSAAPFLLGLTIE